ncbi:MAG: hypothetical protein QXK12_05925 [Candidatus Nezhaarchaeales archaeon]
MEKLLPMVLAASTRGSDGNVGFNLIDRSRFTRSFRGNGIVLEGTVATTIGYSKDGPY